MNKIAMDQLIGNDHANLLGQMTFAELFEAMAGGPEALGQALAAYRAGAQTARGQRPAGAGTARDKTSPTTPELPETGRGYAYGRAGMPPQAQGNAYGRLDVPKDQRGAGRTTATATPAVPAVPAVPGASAVPAIPAIPGVAVGPPPVFAPTLPAQAKRRVRS